MDDDSEDNSFELFNHEKVLLKVTKKRKGIFDDLGNRNLMLRLSSFFTTEWFCVMDIDERFDVRFADFDKVTSNPNIDTIVFRYVNLWNGENTYNTEYPYSRNGILEYKRMFRNIGSCQIITSKKKLHCSPIPYQMSIIKSEILCHHLCNINATDREKRYQFYKKEDLDNDQQNYDHIIHHNAKLLNLKDIYLYNGIFYNKYDPVQ